MKFNALIGDSKGADVFVRSVNIVSKLCPKSCIVRLAPDDVSFVSAYSVRNGMSLEFKIPQRAVFVTYNLEGISPEANAIYFEIPTADLIHSLIGKDSNIKLKLIKKEVPHLKVELVGSHVTHEIPISLIQVRCWPDYDAPNVGLASVMVALPSVRVLQKIMTSMKHIGAKTISIKANNSGEMCLSSTLDTANVDVYFQDLSNLTLQGASSEHEMNPEEYFSVHLDLKLLLSFFGGLHGHFNKLLMKIVHGRAVAFVSKQPDSQFRLILMGLTVED